MSVNSIKQAAKCCLGKNGTVSLKDDLLSAVPDWVTVDSTRAALRQLYYPCVPDVVAAFTAIRREGVDFRCWKGEFGLDEYFNPSPHHFQGVQRLRCQGFIAVTGNGKRHSHLLIIDMKSRHVSGPFGSNIQSKDDDPPASDKIIKKKFIASRLKHAGGFQQVGNYLAIGIEEGNTSQVVFFDVSNPEKTTEIQTSRLDRSGLPTLRDVEGKKPYPPKAGAVAAMKHHDDTFLLIVGRSDSNILDFYRSDSASLGPDAFKLFAYWKEGELRSEHGMDNEFGNYQSLKLVQQCDGTVFLVGLHRNKKLSGKDYADLFRINFRSDGHPIITKIANKHLVCNGCNMDAGGGVFVDYSGKLYLYGVQHWLDDDRLRFNEFS